jgi:hypothetical protein
MSLLAEIFVMKMDRFCAEFGSSFGGVPRRKLEPKSRVGPNKLQWSRTPTRIKFSAGKQYARITSRSRTYKGIYNNGATSRSSCA